MAAYLVAQIQVTRPEGFQEYRERVGPCFARFGGRYLVRGGPVETLEGSYDGRRLVIFEFPDMEALHAAWSSDEYAGVKRLREGSAVLDVWAVPGVEPGATS
jgi:uncharacterized protein (DUF1330 family)